LPEQIVIRIGEERRIRLPSLSGAGYEWAVEITEGDPKAVAVRELSRGGPAGPP
jgi:hypothetical protein